MTKRGLAGGTQAQIATVGASWSYIWYPAKDRPRVGYEHVPLVKRDLPSEDALRKLVDCRHWLVFNEPDFYSGDGYIKPVDAAPLYHQLRTMVLAVRPDARFIVGGTFWPNNLTWLNDFRTEYKAAYGAYPIVDGWHVHNYAEVQKYTQQQWRDLLTPIKGWLPAGAEFWLTEFGCLQSDAIGERVMREQIPWLESQPWVTRYAWYTSYDAKRQGSLFTGDDSTTLTALGKLYASFGPPAPPPWTPPPFVNGMRRYRDPSIKDGCNAVLEYGSGSNTVRRYACQLPTCDHLWHWREDGTVGVEWREG
jgi:hypothetical protein